MLGLLKFRSIKKRSCFNFQWIVAEKSIFDLRNDLTAKNIFQRSITITTFARKEMCSYFFARYIYIYTSWSHLWKKANFDDCRLKMRPSGSITCQKLRQFKLSTISHFRWRWQSRSSLYIFLERERERERERNLLPRRQTKERASGKFRCLLWSLGWKLGKGGERFAIGSPLAKGVSFPSPRVLERLLIVPTAKRFEFKVDLISVPSSGVKWKLTSAGLVVRPGDLPRV